MPNLRISSDYDERMIDLLRESKLLIVDLDGTLIDFEKIDNVIIKEMFPQNKWISRIDRFLWMINRLDLIGNGYLGLKIRLFFYSLFSRHTYAECKEKYRDGYVKLARVELHAACKQYLKFFIEKGYEVRIVTKNTHAENLLDSPQFSFEDYIPDKFKLVVIERGKLKELKKIAKFYKGKVCVIGNNFCDDIISSCRIKAPYVYVGKSKVVIKLINMCNLFFKKKGVAVERFQALKEVMKQ